ncbi:hypothetical protein QKC54_gp0030 [Megavirus baoshan]|uniref:F-box and FNIP repeat-containing protein n=1 Tax=Megavirus baoshan TaxID=2496520 RepID=A0A8K1W9H1_9VIRU|nr:hypothetical protein QKC54_gp0030 [Megavirus baoshan]UFX99926.1 hypothetical protein Mb1042 [Megavirus baoshan]
MPDNIKYLKFGQNFNKPIGENISHSRHISYLPNSITYLTFGYHFNRSIKIVYLIVLLI